MTALFFCLSATILFFGGQWHGRCAADFSQEKEFRGNRDCRETKLGPAVGLSRPTSRSIP
jgi:hypothetical protein